MNQHSLKAVIFDLDGGILDSMPSHVAAWRQAFDEIGVELGADFFYRHEGMLDWSVLKKILMDQGFNHGPGIFDRASARQREIYLEKYADQVWVYPQVDPLISGLLAKGLKLALVTSSFRQVLKPELSSWLDDHFQVVITRDQVKRGKPHPDPYLKAVADLAQPKQHMVVVENAPAGILAARTAGLFCIALATTLPAG
ncbi:MAG: HAD family phosphatase, partial [Deltaproteobacteria bacterium]|nr:HAD family phosphatase [Deltaproteobacteria bacterium]